MKARPPSRLASAHAGARLAGWLAVVLLPGVAIADDAARISRLETEIQQLRSQIDEQNRRIQRLEAELNRANRSADQPTTRSRARAQQADQPMPKGPQPWHSAAAWDRVAKGMTVDAVTAILGAPTASESVDALKTLFYRGTTPSGVSLHGHVNLRDDRVVAVSKPAFQSTAGAP
jgi:hypothetical protein